MRTTVRAFLFTISLTAVVAVADHHQSGDHSSDTAEGFTAIFDGQSLDGWKVAEENQDGFKVEDGSIVVTGERSHLYYDGELAPMKNFHFIGEVKLEPNANSGIYFHTRYQPTGWPKYGYECQVNVSHGDPKKTGSVYAVVNVDRKLLDLIGVKDNEWYTQEIIVKGKNIVSKVNGVTVVDYTEPPNKPAYDGSFERRLDEGTIALQAHDPGSVARYRNLRVKPLD